MHIHPSCVCVLSIRSQKKFLRRSYSALCRLTWHQPSGLQSSCSSCWWHCSTSHKLSNPKNLRSCWARQPSSTPTTSPSRNTFLTSTHLHPSSSYLCLCLDGAFLVCGSRHSETSCIHAVWIISHCVTQPIKSVVSSFWKFINPW